MANGPPQESANVPMNSHYPYSHGAREPAISPICTAPSLLPREDGKINPVRVSLGGHRYIRDHLVNRFLCDMEITSGYVCDRGLNPKRPVNQDRYLVDPARSVFAVFDGVGGQRAGEVASQTAAETVEEALAVNGATPGVSASGPLSKRAGGLRQNSSVTDRVRSAIAFANRDIYELAGANPEYDTMATTVALVQIEGDLATIAHVGDSRVYRFEWGQLYKETIDHTDFDDRVRAGLIQPGLGATNDSHIINRALGSAPDVEVEIKTIRVSQGTRFLICTDGVYRMIADEEIATILAGYEDPQSAADELKRVAHERGADDNLTAVVVHAGRVCENGRRESGQPTGEPLTQGAHRRTTSGLSRPASDERIGQPGRSDARERGADRISVPLDSGRRPITSRETNELRSRTAEAGNRPALWILLLAGLVLLVGGFYLGLRVGDWRRSRTAARPLSTNAAELIEGAKRAFEGGDYTSAEIALSKVAAEQPASIQANYWLGRTELAEGKLQDAVRHFDGTLSLDPNLLDAYLQEAGAYELMGDKSKAAEMLARYSEARRKAQSRKQ